MRRAMFAWAGIGLLLLAAGCSMCAHPYDYCGPVYDGPCTSCSPCGGGGGGGQCGGGGGGGQCGGGGCSQPDDMCRPCVSRAGSILSGGGGGVVPAGAVVEGDVPTPVTPLAGQMIPPGATIVEQPAADGTIAGPAFDGEPMLQGGEIIQEEPVIQPNPSGARWGRPRQLR